MTEETKHAPISDERLAQMLVEVDTSIETAFDDAEADGNPQLAANPVAEFNLDEMRSALTELQERRAHSLPSAVTDAMVEAGVSAWDKSDATDPFDAMRASLTAALSLPIAQPAGVRPLDLLDPKDDEAIAWVSKNLHALRRDNGDMEYRLAQVVRAYQAGKCAIEAAPPIGLDPAGQQWRAVESGEPRTNWMDVKRGDLAGWEALAKRNPEIFSVEKRGVFALTPAQPEDETSNHVQDIAARAVVYQCAECVRAEHEFCCYPAEQVFIIGGEVFCTECAKSRGAEPRKKVPNLAEKLKRQRGSVRSADLRAEAAEAESARLREAVEGLDRLIRGNIHDNGADIDRMKIGGEWHTGPVVDASFRILRGIQKIARSALSGEPHGKL